MYTHICVSAKDLAASAKFYEAALTPLGINNLGAFSDKMHGFGTDSGMLIVTIPSDGNTPTHSNGGTISLVAPSNEAVDAFHAAGIANGGTDEGGPGPRPNAPNNAYGAYLRDPVGNKICAFHGF
jgi:catechol 2,3-dioxygenase-like lactoylglutathione lyase family enzyme